MPIRVLIACVFAALPVAIATAQTPPPSAPPPQQRTPTFRTGVDLVAVDVSVVDRNGRPVDNLRPAEFTLKVDGQPRSIASAEFVSFRHGDDAPASNQPFSTSLGRRSGRLIMIVIDEANIRRGSINAIIEAATTFVDTLGRSDRVAVQILPGAGPVLNFTADHALVKRVLHTAVGNAVEAERTNRVGVAEAIEILERPWSGTGVPPQGALAELFERECPGEHDQASIDRCRRELEGLARTVHAAARSRAASTMLALREIVDRLALSSGPKTLVLITEGVLVGRNFADVSWVPERTSAAAVSLYGLRVDNEQVDAAMPRISPTRRADRDLLVEGLDHVVGLARGTVFPLGANPQATFTRLNLELSGYYLLSFQPQTSDRDGKPHQISIGVSRPGVTLRGRREFSVDTGTRAKPVDARLMDVLKSPVLLSDFGVHVTTFTYRDSDTAKLKVLIAAQIERAPSSPEDLALAYYATDEKNNVVATHVEPALDAPRSAESARQRHFTGSFLVDPGRYGVKLAVIDGEGRAASVEHTFQASLTAVGQLRLGELMIAAAPRPGDGVRPAVDGRVATDTLVGYTELYSEAEPQLSAAVVTLEVAGSAEGATMASIPMRMGTGPGRGRRTHEGSLPLALLSPGAYVARAVISVEGRPIGRVTRPFTLVRSAAVLPVASADATATTRAATSKVPVPFSSRIDAFDRSAVLSRPVVGFFLNQIARPGLPALPDDLTAAIGLARTGRFDDAGRVVETVGSDHFAAPFLAGLAHLAQGDLQRAALSFGASLQSAPEFFPAAFYLGACYAADGRDREALVAWRAGLVVESEAPFMHTVVADALLRLRDTTQAVLVLRQAAGVWPDSDEVQMRLGTALAMAGSAEEAIRILDKYLTRHADDHERLLLAMRLIYEARAAGRVIDAADVDRARFLRFFDAYTKAGGRERELVERWRRVVDR
ncbi:MAG TPA: VWA domain-containing protein [Vicinamibacterales bacterium]|nr:VWA domain-containing protein [Vicinamibacterales bacterium]